MVDLEQVALRLMRAVDVQVLVLDEVHNILAGKFREQRSVLNTLRYLSNELKISLVCFGVNEAREAISGDVQLARRFEEFPLPRWSAEEGFEQLVLAIIRNLPPFGRRTTRLAGIVKLFGHGAGGRPSERLTASLGMPVSDTTILRSVTGRSQPRMRSHEGSATTKRYGQFATQARS